MKSQMFLTVRLEVNVDHIKMDIVNGYIKKLTSEYPEIQSIWLFGSRANNTSNNDSDWDLLIFANQNILNQLKQNKAYRHNNIDPLIVYDGNNFQSPWLRIDKNAYKSGNLNEWKWDLLNNKEAQYEINAGVREAVESEEEYALYTPRKEILKAVRIWPKN